MKTLARVFSRSRCGRDGGFALVAVLGLTVLLLGIVLLFISRAGTERAASSSYAATADARGLSDTVVNLVQAQINHATTRRVPTTWASQPGAVWLFDGTGGLTTIYKLYSAASMTETSAAGLSADEPAAGWASSPAQWVDLNEPVKMSSSSGSLDFYPILDPSAVAEGFTISAPAGGTVGQMPVRWLYMLKDGSLVAPGGSGNTATIGGATATNPIVGRVAFWTDDDTCKVNINTASEGSFWDTPRVDTNQDRGYARFQPAQREFQRYPGHPATTSLAPVFFATSSTSTPDLTLANREALYAITPRINGGGSRGGTQVPTAALNLKSDRLYSSLDELYYNVARGEQLGALGLTAEKINQSRFFLTANSRAPEVTLFGTPRVSMWPLDRQTSSAFRTAFDRLIAFCSTINGEPYYFTRTNPKSATEDYDTIPRNQQLYSYLQSLTSRSVPGFGGNFAGKLGLANRDQLLTQIFDYIRTTNLNDSGLVTLANRYGKRGQNNPANAAFDQGNNQVTPIRINTPQGTTQGFGRFPIVTEAGIHFICTARTDNQETPSVDESSGSNVPENKTLRSTPGGPATLLEKSERRIEAMFFVEIFIPSLSNPPLFNSYSVRIRGLDAFAINGQSLQFPADATDLSFLHMNSVIHGRSYGGSFSHRAALGGQPPRRITDRPDENTNSRLPARGGMEADAGATARNLYPFVSVPITIDAASGTMTFTGGSITIDVYPRSSDTVPFPPGTEPVQTVTMTFPGGTFPVPDLVTSGTPASGSFAVETVRQNWWTFSLDGAMPNFRGRIQGWSRTPSPHSRDWDGSQVLLGDPFHPTADVVRTMVPAQNDYRLLAVNLPAGGRATEFVKHPSYDDTSVRLAHSVSENYVANAIRGRTVQIEGYPGPNSGVAFPPPTPVTNGGLRSQPDVPISNNASATGDWDNGMGLFPDGPYVNRPDEGNILNITTSVPYFVDDEQYTAVDQTFFSPNRQIPSAGMLGSLPSQARTGEPFQTLLFRPKPLPPQLHFGARAPADHLITDLFWMPVVEPYAISEPFSTAGKINMNYQIAPFSSFITRATGMIALLRSERILAIPNSAAGTYKLGATPASRATNFRQPIDAQQTLQQFQSEFAAGRLFRSASEIMNMALVPQGQTAAGMQIFWNANRLTGDNSREKPYTNLLGRLTTKSNTYTIHYRVQVLQNPSNRPAGTWEEGRGTVKAEYRGSTTIERYLDPNEPGIPDYATTPTTTTTLDEFYRWRIVENRQFAP